MANYVGILDGKDDVWGARIPDVPGCYGGGPTPEAAMADAASALAELVTGSVKLRAPRSIGAVLADHSIKIDIARGDTLVLIQAPVVKRKKAGVPA